jgi:hypothetical protein
LTVLVEEEQATEPPFKKQKILRVHAKQRSKRKKDMSENDNQEQCSTEEEPSKLSYFLTNAKRADPSFWKKLCSSLSIEGKLSKDRKAPVISSDEAERRRKKLVSDGYVLVDDCLDMDLVNQIKEGIEHLDKQGLPPTFILLFDQTWELARASRSVLESSTHSKNSFNFDLLAWLIKAGKGGFSPHRDRQPEEAESTFHPGDQARFVTQWIALSDATPENSCLHVIPRKYDPGYVDGDTEEDPLRRALPSKESFQHIRALPRTAGQSILFTHRIIHWGSRSDLDSTHPPRIAISFVCSDPSYEAPMVRAAYFSQDEIPPFHIRLLLVCSQLLIYYQRFGLDKEAIKACYGYCKHHEEELEEKYRHKVFVEFVKAMKEMTDKSVDFTAVASDKVKLVVTEEGDEEDEEDAMMEEMLNAETGGYGEFEDDFDELEDGEQEENQGEEEDSSNDEGDEVNIFGKRALESEDSNLSKKVKAALGDA